MKLKIKIGIWKVQFLNEALVSYIVIPLKTRTTQRLSYLADIICSTHCGHPEVRRTDKLIARKRIKEIKSCLNGCGFFGIENGIRTNICIWALHNRAHCSGLSNFSIIIWDIRSAKAINHATFMLLPQSAQFLLLLLFAF